MNFKWAEDNVKGNQNVKKINWARKLKNPKSANVYPISTNKKTPVLADN